jgi:hypothetical protein
MHYNPNIHPGRIKDRAIDINPKTTVIKNTYAS